MKIYGAKFKLYISFDGSFEELVKIVSIGLEVDDIRIENDECAPFKPIAYFEVMGFESVVKHHNKHRYELVGNTMDCFKEIQLNQMHDLSLWLARYIALRSDLVITTVDDDDIVEFRYNKELKKVVAKH